MRLYKRGRLWWARWSVDGEKQRRSTKCSDKKAAQLVLVRWQRELADPHHAAAHKATVESASVRFLSEQKKSCRSVHTYKMYVCKTGHVVRLLGSRRLSQLTSDMVLAFIDAREAEGAKPYTVHRELTALRLTLKSAGRSREFSADPRSVIPRYATGYVPRTRWLTLDELLAVCAHLDTGRAAVLALAVATSSNFSETFKVRRVDVTDLGVRIRGTKRSKRRRFVTHMTHVWPLIAYALAWADGEGEMLFRPWSNMRRDVLAACRRAGVAPLTSNDLRRTCATWLVKQGVDFSLVAKVMGQSSTVMLERVYGQLESADVGRLINEHVQGHSRGTIAAMH